MTTLVEYLIFFVCSKQGDRNHVTKDKGTVVTIGRRSEGLSKNRMNHDKSHRSLRLILKKVGKTQDRTIQMETENAANEEIIRKGNAVGTKTTLTLTGACDQAMPTRVRAREVVKGRGEAAAERTSNLQEKEAGGIGNTAIEVAVRVVEVEGSKAGEKKTM